MLKTLCAVVATGLITLLTLTACTDNQRARSFGGAAVEKLPAGQKLVNITWKEAHMWILTAPMKPTDVPETYTFKESSNFGIVQGTVTIIESR